MSGKVFFTADSHFGDMHILRQRRDFETIEAHDALLIARWNEMVGPDDEVWHVGDFSANASREHCQAVFAQLAGRKRLVRGNHDTNRVLDLPWAAPPAESARFVLRHPEGEVALYLSHYPHRSWPGIWRGSRHLYGHTHARLPDTTRSCDVGVDAWDYWPVTLDGVLGRQAEAKGPPEELAGR